MNYIFRKLSASGRPGIILPPYRNDGHQIIPSPNPSKDILPPHRNDDHHTIPSPSTHSTIILLRRTEQQPPRILNPVIGTTAIKAESERSSLPHQRRPPSIYNRSLLIYYCPSRQYSPRRKERIGSIVVGHNHHHQTRSDCNKLDPSERRKFDLNYCPRRTEQRPPRKLKLSNWNEGHRGGDF